MTKPRRYRFSLRTLLIVVAVVGAAAWAYKLQRGFATADWQWQGACADFEADAITIDELADASVMLRAAEADIPFRGRAAGRAHLERMRDIEKRLREQQPFTLHGSSDGGETLLKSIGDHCQAAADWLADRGWSGE